MHVKTSSFAFFWLFILASTSIFLVQADDNAEVVLTVTVVAPLPETYGGIGYIFIEEQRAYGEAVLYLYDDTVVLEIYRGEEVAASWEWSIIEHMTRMMRSLQLDSYRCEDVEGRRLMVRIYKYSWPGLKRITVMATGRGAFFVSVAH